MASSIWELRFTDGRGASFYTTTDINEDIGKPGLVRRIPVAANVFEGSAVADARKCFEAGNTLELTANMAAVAYSVRRLTEE